MLSISEIPTPCLSPKMGENAQLCNLFVNREPQHVHSRRVEFSETDMAGIVHFANFYRWMEAAEAEWFEAQGFTLINRDGDEVHGWPRVRSHCEFHAPACFRDHIETHLWIKELKIRAIEYAFRFYRIDDGEAQHVASGGMTTVYARRDPQTGAMQSASLPPALKTAIEQCLSP